MFEFRIAHNLLFSFPLQIMMSLKSLPPVVQVHILDKYLDKCFKDEHKQKLNVVFKNLNALVLLSNSVRSHSEEVRPLVLPSCNRPLRYLIEQIERDSRFKDSGVVRDALRPPVRLGRTHMPLDDVSTTPECRQYGFLHP